MGKLILYIATSLDGYIARKNGTLDWLESFPASQQGDYGYSELLDRIGCLIMGRKTYEQVVGFGMEWPYSGKTTYVMTSNPNYAIKTPNTEVRIELSELILELKTREDRDIWLVGGRELVSQSLRGAHLDEIQLALIPRMIGEGIPLCSAQSSGSDWELNRVEHFETGLLLLHYSLKRAS